MFALIRDRQRFSEQGNCAVYACTVGLRPSHAGYYLSEMAELRQLLKALQDKSISANRSYSTTDLTVSVCDGVGLFTHWNLQLLDSRSAGGSQGPLGRRRPTSKNQCVPYLLVDMAAAPGQKPGSTNRRPLEGLIE